MKLVIASVVALACTSVVAQADDPGWRAISPPGRGPTIGTAHPIYVQASASSGRWVATCEARRVSVDDARNATREDRQVASWLAPYLIRGGGDGQPIDAWVTASADARWLVFLRDGALILLDDLGNRERTLVAPPVPTLRDHSHRIAAFSADGTHLAYLRTTRTLVVRELMTSKERTITIPGETIARIVPEPVGPWARVLLRRSGEADAERNYEPPLPPPPAGELRTGAARPCGARQAYWSYGLEGAQRWLNLATGELRDEPDVQARLGEVVIGRGADGALSSDGVELVPARCQPKVLAVSRAPLRIFATCAPNDGRVPLEIFGPAFHARAGLISVSRYTRTVRFLEGAYFCFRRVCVRTTDGREVRMPDADAEALDDGHHVVAWDGSSLAIPTGPSPDRRTPLLRRGLDPAAGRMRAFGRVVVDRVAGTVVGVLDADPAALDTRGRGLVAEPGPDLQPWDLGPLRWIAPR